MSDELPQGWATAPLATIAEARMGETILARQLTPAGVPVYSAGQGNNPWGFLENPRKPHGKGTVVVSARGSIGFPKIPKAERFASTQTTIALRFPDEEFAAYGCLWLKTVDWSALTKGGAIPMLTVGDINELVVPLAPLAEQRRIVAKLDELLGKVDASQQRLAKIPVLLKRFRQSVLATACSGRLTADWREENPTIEPAEVLLARIKEKRLASAKSQKEKTQIEEVFDERNLRDDEGDVGLDDLPDTWLSCRIGAIGAVCNGSTPSRKQPEFWDGTIPWISSGEVRNNLISETHERITNAGYEGSSVRLLPRGSVLIAMFGEGKTRGQTAILKIEATINQNIAAVVLDHGLVASAYL